MRILAHKVFDNKNNIIGIFLTDYFARPSKQGGAFTTSYQDQSKNNGIKYPIVINVSATFQAFKKKIFIELCQQLHSSLLFLTPHGYMDYCLMSLTLRFQHFRS